MSALAGVVVLVLLSAGLAWQQYVDTRDTALNGVRARAALAASVLDTYFTGQVGTLQAMAAAPAVVSLDLTAMDVYLERVKPTAGKGFTGGIGWVDTRGVSRVSSTTTGTVPGLSVADRSYFKTVMTTGKPFVSEGVTTRRSNERAVVVAVPTRDAGGRLTGMIVGAILVKPTPTSKASIDLGFAGLAIFDRTGQSVLNGFVKPKNAELLEQLRTTPTGGVVAATRGLDGRPNHVVGYATSPVPAWIIAIDQPRSTVLSPARRSLQLALALITGVAAIVLLVVIRTIRRARRDADRRDALARQQRDLAGALATASAVQDVSQALARSLAEAFPGALAVVALAADDRLGVRIAATAGGAFDRSVHGAAVMDAAEEAHLTGAAVAHSSESELRARAPQLAVAFAGAVGSSYAVPLVAPDGDRVGALVLLFGDEHPLDAGEQALLAAQAGQVAVALQRTRERERDHEATVRLQRSLLPDRLPEIEGLDLAARYNAGGTGLEIGGDWYDVVHRSDGLVHLTVGDVAGRGIGAAALMGQLRNAFRAYALDHTSPADVMQRLLRHVGHDEMATAVVVTLDPASGELRYASAGHPPPLVVDDRTGMVSLLDLPAAPPLGAPESGTIEEGREPFLPGATIVLYTDGLIEHRGASIDDGVAAVASALAANAALPPGALADVVLDRAGADGDLADDIALLVVRFTGVPTPAVGPSEPDSTSVFGSGG